MIAANAQPHVRDAVPADLPALRRFGELHVRAHYASLIGPEVAQQQVVRWWNESQLGAAVAEGRVVVAVIGDDLVGVGQRGRNGSDHVIYKLYVHPDFRGHGVGPRLIDGLIAQLPADVDRLFVEQFAGNERAGFFYQREGFDVQRIEPSPTGNPALAQVWRVRRLDRSPETN